MAGGRRDAGVAAQGAAAGALRDDQSRAGRINPIGRLRGIPQVLKPALLLAVVGTTKVVPFYTTIYATGFMMLWGKGRDDADAGPCK